MIDKVTPAGVLPIQDGDNDTAELNPFKDPITIRTDPLFPRFKIIVEVEEMIAKSPVFPGLVMIVELSVVVALDLAVVCVLVEVDVSMFIANTVKRAVA